MRTKDVFTPGKFPTVTFVDDHLAAKTKQLRDAIEAGGLVVSLSGPSKAGKTVFVEHTLGKDSIIHVTGAGIDKTSKLWERVFDIIGTPVDVTKVADSSFQGTLKGDIAGEVGWGIKGKGKVGASGTWAHGQSKSESPAIDHLQLLIRELAGTDLAIFIDDFHYVAASIKRPVAEQIKEAIRNDVLVITASVPYHSDDAIRANKDLQGRVHTIDLDYWTPDLLIKIAASGFSELNIDVDDALVSELARESAGSPQLMQSLCLNLCFEQSIYETAPSRVSIPYDKVFLHRVCMRTALMVDYSTTISLMNEGPKTRGQNRTGHTLHDGSVHDVYPIIIKALAIDPPQLTFRYNDLVKRIESLCATTAPAGSSVTGACEHISRLANDSTQESVIEWDSEMDVLDIRDPYLLFSIRWGNA